MGEIRVHIDYTASIADSSTLQYHVAQRSDDIVHERTSCACIFERPGYTASRPVCLPTHALFDLYFAHLTSSLFKVTTAPAGRAYWVASTAMQFPCLCRVQSTEVCWL